MRLLVVLGPTGTGKSALALRLAETLGGEIVGCDALQIYDRFDIGTAKPTAEDRARVPHHLVGSRPPELDCTLAEYVGLAGKAIDEVAGRGRVPVVVGGTGLYLRGLLQGVIDAPSRDLDLRKRLGRMRDRYGVERLHRWLRSVDPRTAARLNPRDGQRIVRALEVALLGAGTWSDRLRAERPWGTSPERYRSLKIGLDLDRAELASRLDRRVDAFFAAGWVDEVRGLLEAGVPTDVNAFSAIGYREILQALTEATDPGQTRETIRRKTRRYAKRQRTWFRREPQVAWLDASRPAESLEREVVAMWKAGG